MLEKASKYYTYNDISILPSKISTISHRSECNPYLKDGMLPLFAAPMSTVVDENNFKLFERNKINAILPRNIEFSKRMSFALSNKWAAFSLKEFEEYFCNPISDFASSKNIRVLIDVANGHMKIMYDLVKKSKEIFKDRIKIMVGNIANAETYIDAFEAGVDYIRVGIGGGNGCITSSNTACHAAIATLIDKIHEVKMSLIGNYGKDYDEDKFPKIIADGGIRNYNDVIKALSLGADYVMIGSVFSKAIESAAKMVAYVPNAFKENEYLSFDVSLSDIIYDKKTKKYSYKDGEKIIPIVKLVKIFYGMASAQGQKDLYGKKIKTSEGIQKELEVEYTLHGWTENFIDFLRSAMSYTNSKTLSELKNAEKIILSENAFNAINK